MVETAEKIILNLGCGYKKMIGAINVDNWGDPDVQHDLTVSPYPWPDNSVDEILMFHVLEHIPNWWTAFTECARILKPGGRLEIRVPDESSGTALTYRDHHHVFSILSFHGTIGTTSGTNAWAKHEEATVPLRMVKYYQVPHKQYNWMTYFPRLLNFCSLHLRNFIHEQIFIFEKDRRPEDE